MDLTETDENTWAVVLAAGEGSRLLPLTRELHGHDLPKQFAALAGDRTFLQLTLERIAPLAPPERTVVVVPTAYEALAQAQLRGFPGVEIVAQPRNRGTGPGVLLPLAHVLSRAPGARVAVFPSDHHVRRPSVMVAAVRRALRAADVSPAGIALVAAAAERPATDFGWIVPGAPLDGDAVWARAVARFVEKPPEAAAMELLRDGALWNTMIVAGSARALWRMARRHIPEAARGLERYQAARGQVNARGVLEHLYGALPSSDLSRDVLERARGLAVVPMIDAGWSDCGTPERLVESLRGSPALGALLARLARTAPRAVPPPAAVALATA